MFRVPRIPPSADGFRCVECEHDGISKFATRAVSVLNRTCETVRSPDRHLYQCLKCGHQLTSTVCTIFNDLCLPVWCDKCPRNQGAIKNKAADHQTRASQQFLDAEFVTDV
jgi:hypothetical protein